jgi:hypothetical protein
VIGPGPSSPKSKLAWAITRSKVPRSEVSHIPDIDFELDSMHGRGVILEQGAGQSGGSKSMLTSKCWSACVARTVQQAGQSWSTHNMSDLDKTLSPIVDEIPWAPEAERKLVRKIDLCLLPMLWIMNLLSWMDRANLGNANIAGLTSDLRLSSSQFSLAVITYYCESILHFVHINSYLWEATL